MKILITGATGLIGKAIIHELFSTNHTVNFLTTSKNKLKFYTKANGFYWNPNKGEIDLNCFTNIDSIIHLSGVSISKLWTKKNKKKILESRVFSTRLLLKSLILLSNKINLKSIISASAIGVYPSSFDKIHYENDQLLVDSFLQKVVSEWENEVLKFSKLNCFIVRFRIGLVLSKNGGLIKSIKTPMLFGLGSAFGSGKQIQTWIHINDLVSLFINSIENKWDGVYNAVSPNPVNQNKIMELILRNLHKPYFIPNIPK